MLKGNKGEWSEIFVFFKLLVEGNMQQMKDLIRLKKCIFQC